MTRTRRSAQGIRLRVFLPFGLALLGILAASCFAILWQKHLCVREKLETRLALVTQIFRAEMNREAELMHGVTDFLEKDARLQEDWRASDRDKLLEHSRPHFEEICSK